MELSFPIPDLSSVACAPFDLTELCTNVVANARTTEHIVDNAQPKLRKIRKREDNGPMVGS